MASNVFGATIADGQGVGTILDDDTLRLILEDSGPDPQQATAFDSMLLVRDPFHVESIGDWMNLLSDKNTSDGLRPESTIRVRFESLHRSAGPPQQAR